MDFVNVDGKYLLDGGVTQHIPIQKAIDEGAEEIDIIVLREENPKCTNWTPKGKSWFATLLRTIDIMEAQISNQNVIVGQLQAKSKDVKLRFR
jgi:predicted patatin/cPLA2 family phospholipase